MIRGLLIALLTAGACSKSEPEPAEWTAPPVMQQPEQARGTAACTTYVARLCACAETNGHLKDRCQLARQQPEALAQLLSMINGEQGRLGQREVREAQHTARRIIKDCFEKEATLDPSVCPR